MNEKKKDDEKKSARKRDRNGSLLHESSDDSTLYPSTGFMSLCRLFGPFDRETLELNRG